jgi:hypothetical protein
MIFRGSEAVAAGHLTHAQLRGPLVTNLFRDVYADGRIAVTHPVRCRGATLVLPPDAVITGRSAATIRGCELARPHDPVEVVAPLRRRITWRDGIRLRRTELAREESEPWHGGRIASPLRMALDLTLARPLPDAVADLDVVLRAGLVEHTDLTAAGLHPVPQYWIEDRSGRLARVDLAFPERKVAVEYDGEWRDGQLWALNHDRERLNRVHAAGWDVVFVTQPLLANPRKMIYTVEAALRAA